jgi:maltooligosyltrehalose trehalohydrolase
MLFMGEEWGASTPWQYFTSHEEPALAEAVRAGRRREFAAHGWASEDVPDPQDPATVTASTLRWDELAEPQHADLLAWHRDLIALRRTEPDLSDPRLDRVAVSSDATAQWVVVTRGDVRVVCNLAPTAQDVPLDATAVAVLLSSDDSVTSPDPGATSWSAAPESVAILRVAT